MDHSSKRRCRAAVSIALLSTQVLAATPLHAATRDLAKTSETPSYAEHEFSARVEGRIANLHSRLGINPAQEPAFDALAAVMRANGRVLDTLLQQRIRDQSDSAVDSLHWYERLTHAHAEALTSFVPAFDRLYAVLSPEQRKTADAIFRRFAERPVPPRRE
jgi:hypothetical protein